MKTRGLLITGLIIFGLILLAGSLASLITSHSPTQQNLEQDLSPPGKEHPIGTDKLGRDVLTRVLYGTQLSLFVGFITVAIALSVGFIIGSLSAFYGGWMDLLLMRLIDILMAFPGILVAFWLVSVLGPGTFQVVLGLSLLGWLSFARLVRGEILLLKEKEHIHAAKALGASSFRVIFHHMLPNMVPPLLVQTVYGASAAIMGEGALSFLGLGVLPPTPSWGSMLNEGRQFLLVAPHLIVFPGLAITLAILSLNLIADGLREVWEIKS